MNLGVSIYKVCNKVWQTIPALSNVALGIQHTLDKHSIGVAKAKLERAEACYRACRRYLAAIDVHLPIEGRTVEQIHAYTSFNALQKVIKATWRP